ncbi:MAG: hypothetical protein S0880_06980 [Actinomycetota bacterium]|nr:hypothetical protein [Actinomycetota bacterium]
MAAPASPVTGATTTHRTLVAVVWSAVLTGVVIGPMAGRGWVVTLDWVVGPHTTFADRIGSGASLPAGPAFFAVAAAVDAVAGAAVGWLVPALWLVVAGWAGSRLVPTSLAARLAGATAVVWNPFVHERLYAGHVATLAGYALLVALVAALAHPGGERPWLRWGGWWAAASACSVQFLVIGAAPVAAVVLVVGPGSFGARLRRMAAAAAVATTCTLAWLLPALADAPDGGDASTANAFTTRADPRLGLLVGTLLQRGFWRASPGAPGVDGSTAANVVAAAVAVAAIVGWWRARRLERPVATALAVVAVVGWVVAWGTGGPFGWAHRFVVDAVPGGAALREPGKFLALLAIASAYGLAHAADGLTGALGRRRPGRLVGAALVVTSLAPIALTPGLAWGVGGRLAAVRYPAEWERAAAVIEDAAPGGVVVVPFDAYLDPGFTGGRVVTHPAPAFFGPAVVVSDDPRVPGLAGSDDTRRIAEALAGPAPVNDLGGLGIDRVLTTAAGYDPAAAGFVPESRAGRAPVWRAPR